MARKKSINDINAQLNRITAGVGGVRVNPDTWEYEANDSRQQGRFARALSAAGHYRANIENSKSGQRAIARSNRAFREIDDPNSTEARRINDKFKSRQYSQRTYMGLANG